jgi:hypothetical protein
MTAQNQTIGPVIYDLNDGNPLGGCEQLPVVISTGPCRSSGTWLAYWASTDIAPGRADVEENIGLRMDVEK